MNMNEKKVSSFFDDFEDIKKPNKNVLNDKNIKEIKDNKKLNSKENEKTNEYSGFTIIDMDLFKKIK